jgi:hypothetical protein
LGNLTACELPFLNSFAVSILPPHFRIYSQYIYEQHEMQPII